MLRRSRSILLGLVVTALFAILLVTVLVPKIFGLVPLSITSESMTPTLPVGTLVAIKPIAPDEVPSLPIGTVVTFQQEAGGPYITHRIVETAETTNGYLVTTQGDANNMQDEPVTTEQVHGHLAYSVPYAGFLSGSTSGESKGLITTIAGSLLLLGAVSMLIPELRARKQQRIAEKDEILE